MVKRNPYRKTVCSLIAVAFFAPFPGRAQAPAYTISTVAGNGTNGYSGDGGLATAANLSSPCGVAVDNAGNLYIADNGNSRIRKVSAAVINTVVGSGTAGYSGDGGPATQANISQPCGVAVDSSGNIYFSQSDVPNSAVRKAPASGNISTLAGTTNGGGFSGDGGAATGAQVNGPTGLALDSANNLYIVDTLNDRIRVIASNGNITTLVGNGIPQFSGDGGSPTRASINNPQSIAIDPSGNLYIADTFNNRIRKVSGNVITTIAGTGTAGFSGDGGPATQAQLNFPKGVAVDAAGDVFIVDSFNWRVRQITPDGTIWTIAGRSTNGYSGDGGPATSARLSFPEAIAVGPNGTLYVSDTQNNVIRLLTPGTTPINPVTPPAVSSMVSASACGAYASVAPGSWMEIHGIALATDTRSWTASDFNGINAPTMLDGTQVSVAGQNAVLSYISPTQVNAQVPLNISPGNQQLTVTTAAGTSAPFTVTVNATQAGLCQGGVQISGNIYLAATIAGTTTYVLPASANPPGITSRPAHPGEVITVFGNGFGPVTPAANQGQLVQQPNQLTNEFDIFFGPTQATVQYAGLAPGYVGLYQFNIVVPNIPDSDAVPVTFALGNFAGAPTLYTAVHQ
ncbi:MAG TPA: hypothetical protein VG096_24750 [Bryobacteraceae bacterium]|jgi:uncharacterized protein (TIGR03437 family)|nr:hypothetical protein [Bryobacteraceae bacterium]